MRILALSDTELKRIHSDTLSARYADVDLLISCGDLSHAYLEFVMTALNRTLYYVDGNHRSESELSSERSGINLHGQCVRGPAGVLIAGIQGSGWYNGGTGQYNQSEMWSMVLQLVPRLLSNKATLGRFLDIFVTHAPPWGTHDREDLPHQGIKAFRWFDRNFRPRLHLHGHVHLYHASETRITDYYKTTIINCYGFQDIQTSFPHLRFWQKPQFGRKYGRKK